MGLTRPLRGHKRDSGVLAYQDLHAAVRDGWITAEVPLEERQFQPASLDLRLGRAAYQLRASFLPLRESVRQRLHGRQIDFTDPNLVIETLQLDQGATLQRGVIYLVELQESLQLPPGVRGRCNPKSTTGRLDIFTRVIADRTPRFDEVKPGYRGPLFVEVSPRSFPIRVQTGVSLSQVRLVRGESLLSENEVHAVYTADPLLYNDDDEPLAADDAIGDGGLSMGIDLSGRKTDGIIGYRARANPQAVDLSRVDFYDPAEFWEPIRERNRDSYILEADRFYVLVSKERIRVLPQLAAEMSVYDIGAGEIRTHYAGFFDPGFGFGDGTLLGTKAVLEVRAREVPVVLYDGQTLFSVRLERLTGRPERVYGTDVGSSYQNQTLTLSKQFKRW
jgi:dCTP deaminase